MQVGRTEIMDQSQVQHAQKVEKVLDTAKIREVEDNEDYKKQERELKREEPVEVSLPNVSFGYNRSSGDFYIQILQKDGSLAKYPTEDMMKLKSLLQEEAKKENYL